jgi:uncharacterized membrane protein YfcA
MLPLAIVLSILVGVSLGMLGGGGSILTVPILTYVVGMAAKDAITASLFVVGVTSSVGAIVHARAGRVRWRSGLVFGAAGMAGAFSGGALSAFLPGRVLMVLFGLMMSATAIAMLRRRRSAPPAACEPATGPALVHGFAVGSVTGLVGAGGGFVVVPALCLLGGLPIEIAVGTSLLVIAMNAFAGLASHLGYVDIDWGITLAVTAAAVAGSFVGIRFAERVSPATLRRAFGILVIVMAVFVLARELAG